ncbi:Dynamin central region-domain-containing protein [Mycotypha africana]|uniref:Dynamin central region-domain-containing protein n=1 Tax=Mycotypha africana TaxID=64632 RepID=UPI00230029CD|nr:Dynamin central region-domain-containing protein [Mycotypha africana]KAI8988536.1 Dynamin central region-domain-containing protein [Mycotypha africana]
MTGEGDIVELINKIQDAFAAVGGSETLDLPQIIAIGEQSSGKSSVLEQIVQRDFLPRGSGIVTRRPLILQLISSRNQEEDDYAEFLHLPQQRIYDFDEVRDEIVKETDRVAGTNKGISSVPINLKIHSRNVLNLTLIDLPGLTKFPIGDQPHDIDVQIRKLALDYISKPNSIILAITPANTDLANSDSLKLAKQADPKGNRTIGVLSKLDLMDTGTNALEVLTGKSFPLRMGFIGVVNRSQQDIIMKKSMADAIESERIFFHSHPAYKSIAQRCGVAYLTHRLNSILVNHIREKLPDLRSKVSAHIGQAQHELAQYGNSAFTGSVHRGSLVLKLLNSFSNEFISSINGTSSEISTKELSGGARIYFIFNSVFGQALDNIHPCADLTNDDIRTAIRNSTGPRCSLFVPEASFELLVRPQIRLLEAPSLRCVDLVYEELSKICHTCSNQEITRFPKLNTRLVEVVSDLLQEQLKPSSSFIRSMIEIECAYINTNHPDFPDASQIMMEMQRKQKEDEKAERKRLARQQLNGGDMLTNITPSVRKAGRSMSITSVTSISTTSSSPPKDSLLNYFARSNNSSYNRAQEYQVNKTVGLSQVLSAQTDAELQIPRSFHMATMQEEGDNLKTSVTDIKEVELIRRLIIAYFNIVRRSIKDRVPKAIMHLLVNYTKDNVQNRLVSSLYREELFDDLLVEDPLIAAEREKCKAMLDVYKNVFTLINEAM